MNTSKIKWSDFLRFENNVVIFGGIFICLVSSSVLGYLSPQFTFALPQSYGNKELFLKDLRNLGILFIVIYLNRIAYQLMINKFVQLLVQRVRTLCFEFWLRHYEREDANKGKRKEYPQGEVLARILNDTEAVRELITSGTFGIIIDLTFVISALVSFISISPFIGGSLAFLEVVAVILLIWGSKYMREIFLSVRNSRGEMSRTVANIVGGLSDSYRTPHGNYASKKGEVVFDDFLKKQLSSNVWDASYYSIAESLYPLFLAALVFLTPYGNITNAAIIFTVLDLIQRSINPVKDIAGKIANVQRAYTGFIRIRDFLEDLLSGDLSPVIYHKHKVDFESLEINLDTFKYNKRAGEEEASFELKDIHFSAKKGELVGIVGLSGSGKSTLLGIIAGNILPKNGAIQLHDRNGNIVLKFPDGNSTRYLEEVGIVSQDSHLFSETLSFNITLSSEHSDGFLQFWEDVREQIPYLKSWDIGPETKLDANKLSLGQKQLLAAIRACYLKKSIVLFDEISSGLDSSLEWALRKMILLVQKQSLTFIVAHRLETIVESDQILVLESGRLCARGKHSELLMTSHVYQEFIDECRQ